MSEIALNSFEGGMNKDTSRVVQSKNIASEIYNFRPFTDSKGKSLGGILNIEGNELSFTYPATLQVISFVVSYFAPVVTDTIGFTVNGVLTNIVFNVIGSTDAEIAENYVLQINSNAYCIANNIHAYILEGATFIVYCDSNTVTTFDAGDGSLYLARAVYIPTQTNVQTIGYATLRDDIYLFTTNVTNDVGGIGQIWKLTINPIDKTTSLQIKYNNFVNFSTEYPIEALGRYETSNIQKLYWTDNFNKVRTISVSSATTFSIPVDNLDLLPLINHSVPVLQAVLSGGAKKTGLDQYAYRLKTLSGGETSISPVSRLIPITTYDESIQDWEYIGGPSGTTVSKSVRIRIDNLDNNYDFIEIFLLHYETEFDLPTIRIINQEKFSETFYEYTDSGIYLNDLEISADDFLLSSSTFTHAKTLTSKDNHLFVGNVRREVLSIPHDEFDSRAYSFDELTNIFEVDNTVYNLGAGDLYTDVVEDANAINTDRATYKFARNSSEYGGTGPYIEYKIKTKKLKADTKQLNTSGGTYENLPYSNISTQHINPEDLDEGIIYPQPPMFDGSKNPHVYDLFKSYQKDEIYRFGIVFYDLQGNPGFVNWIADIQIPESYDPARLDGYNQGSFDGKYIENTTVANYDFNVPYIEFEVNLPQFVINKITGYSIVRVERTSDDRTILGQGLSFPIGPSLTIDDSLGPDVATALGPLDNGNYLFSGIPDRFQNAELSETACCTGLNVQDTVINFGYNNLYVTVQFPEHILADNINFLNGDYIKTVDLLGSTDSEKNQDIDFRYTSSTVAQSISLFKKYKFETSSNPYANKFRYIDKLWSVSDKGIVSIDSGITFRNELCAITRDSATLDYRFGGFGGKTILLKTLTNPLYSAYTSGGGTTWRDSFYNQYIVNYKRVRINQYGGNTYTQRSFNNYISTGNFIPVTDTYTTTTFEVFGGDIFPSIFGSLKYRKTWEITNIEPTSSSIVLAYFFGVESYIHSDFRYGNNIKSHGLTDDGANSTTDRNNNTLTGSCDLGEQYIYNKVFSKENNFKKFIAKPTFFNNTNEFDTRIYNSSVKINGESLDSWRMFKPNDYIDLEANYGPINKIIAHNDTFFSLQDDSVSIVGVNPRAVLQGDDGVSLELGTGLTLNNYEYISTVIGSKSQWSVIPAKSYVYFLDVKANKIMRVSPQGLEPLSDVKGFNSYLTENLKGNIRLDEKNRGDNPLKFKGATGYYDHENNEVVFTIHGVYETQELESSVTYQVGDYILNNGVLYQVTTSFTYNKFAPNLIPNSINLGSANSFTIVFNENIDNFASFYDFHSTIYPHNREAIFSPNPINLKNHYRHNIGNRCSFYGTIYDSTVSPILNDKPIYTKTFDNLFWHTESTNNLVDVPNNTFDNVQVLSTYQANLIPLTVNTNLKRKERTWQMAVPRNTTQERFRDKHLELKLSYDNSNNYRFLVHYLGYVYRVSYR